MKTLKLCPFCGSTAKLCTTPADRDGPGVTTVRCDSCGSQGGKPRGIFTWRCASNGQTKEQGVAAHDAEAIRLWNIRAE